MVVKLFKKSSYYDQELGIIKFYRGLWKFFIFIGNEKTAVIFYGNKYLGS